MRGKLGSSVPREDTFFIALHAHDALDGGKIGKVPNLFADEKVIPIRHIMHGLVKVYLIFLGKHGRGGGVQTGNGVRAVFRKHQRLVKLLPVIQFNGKRLLGGL